VVVFAPAPELDVVQEGSLSIHEGDKNTLGFCLEARPPQVDSP
jgi:hypothetical protein